jgi:hypothetical protein
MRVRAGGQSVISPLMAVGRTGAAFCATEADFDFCRCKARRSDAAYKTAERFNHSHGQPFPGSKEQLREVGAGLRRLREAIVAQTELCAMRCAYVDLPCEGDIACAAAGGSGPKARLARQ